MEVVLSVVLEFHRTPEITIFKRTTEMQGQTLETRSLEFRVENVMGLVTFKLSVPASSRKITGPTTFSDGSKVESDYVSNRVALTTQSDLEKVKNANTLQHILEDVQLSEFDEVSNHDIDNSDEEELTEEALIES